MPVGPMLLLLVLAQPGEAPAAPQAQLTKLPELIGFVEAEYPPELSALRIEGSVVMKINVDAEGIVERVEIVESSSVAFNVPAMNAAAQFVFSPAEAGELGPVPISITYRYNFVLRAQTTTSSSVAGTQTSTPSEALAGPAGPLPPVNFLGTVKQAGARAPVAFATVTVMRVDTSTPALTRTSTDTDEEGKFAFRGLSPGRHSIEITAPFFVPLKLEETITQGESLEVLYYVEQSERDPYEVVVRAKAPRREVARRTLVLEEIQLIPGTQGDAIRVVQNLPGVARTPFGLGLLVVRGAPPQSTGVFLDGHPLPILFHFGGIGGVTSVIHSRSLEQINFYPGGFSPEYGRLSAGVVELESRNAKTDRIHGEAQLDLFAIVPTQASVFVEGPVSDDPDDGAFVFSLRRSSVDGVFSLLSTIVDTGVQVAPRFWDYQIRYDKPLGTRKRMLTLLAYGSDDELVVTGTDQAGPNAGTIGRTNSRTLFHRINPKLVYRFDEDETLSISPLLGFDFTRTESSGGGSGDDGFSFFLQNWNAGIRIDGTTRFASWLKLRAGGDLRYYNYLAEAEIPIFAPVKDFPSPVTVDRPSRRDEVSVESLASSLYAELEIAATDRLTLFPGIRLDVYDFFADERPLIDPRLIEGRTKVGLDPRLTARYRLAEWLSLKGQAGLYGEPPLPPQFFINADLPLQSAQQYSAGFEWEIVDRLSLDIQGFYRFADNVPRGTGDVEVVDGSVRPVGLRPEGEQRAFGMELLLRLNKRWDLFGWIAYTLSRSEFRREDQEFQQNFFFDQTHNLNVIGVYELGLNWFLGARFRLVTGGALPKTGFRFYDADGDFYRRTTEGIERTPLFHQADVFIQKRWVFDEWYFEASFDIQNVYNQENIEFLIPTFDFKDTINFPGLPFFPSFILKGVF